MKPIFRLLFLVTWCFAMGIFTSCSDDDETGKLPAPEIVSSGSQSETEPYMGKVGQPLTLHPVVKNTEGATYTWILDGGIVGTDSIYTLTREEACELTFLFKVENAGGSAEENIEVRFLALLPPIVQFLVTGKEISVEKGEEYVIEAFVSGDDTREWLVDGQVVGTEPTYTFKREKPGRYEVVCRATNEDGVTADTLQVEVVEFLVPAIDFGKESMFVAAGRTANLKPSVKNVQEGATYAWLLDGVAAGTEAVLTFTPEKGKRYTATLTVTNPNGKAGTASVAIEVVDEPQPRPITPTSSKYFDKVHEFKAAPGQFVNEGYTCYTMEEACAYAEKRMRGKNYVSLGGFGGYIVVGFDHSVMKRSTPGGPDVSRTYDFAIVGNSFKGSSEPGIVWVMQDENGNGLPDDTWYELAGSETGKAETTQNYEITYYRPRAYSSTPWTDNKGESGKINRPYHSDGKEYHTQPYYYPLWVKEDSYTLTGTLLKHRTVDETGPAHPGSWQYWVNGEFDWGYVDNFGQDRLNYEDDNYNAGNDPIGFKIANAIDANGNPVDLKFIDFVKVHTGVNVQAGWLGENSTEVFDFYDLNME